MVAEWSQVLQTALFESGMLSRVYQFQQCEDTTLQFDQWTFLRTVVEIVSSSDDATVRVWDATDVESLPLSEVTLV